MSTITVELGNNAPLKTLWQLFYRAVHAIDCRDYNHDQRHAWAPDCFDQSLWQRWRTSTRPFIACNGNTIIGYADIQKQGLIDHFFVAPDWQNKGIGQQLMTKLLSQPLTVNCHPHANVSLIAKPFFEKNKFEVICQQSIKINDQLLTNFKMQRP